MFGNYRPEKGTCWHTCKKPRKALYYLQVSRKREGIEIFIFTCMVLTQQAKEKADAVMHPLFLVQKIFGKIEINS